MFGHKGNAPLRVAVKWEEEHGCNLDSHCNASSWSNFLRLLDWP